MVSRALLEFSEKVAKSVIQRHWRDHSKSRLDSYHLESNESIGLFGQHITKKPKMTRQPLGSLFDNDTPMSRSFYSPVASQTSNMSISNKLIKILAGRDRGRKAKFFKIPAEQSGPGSPWSLFEDQALVVLVHDMGPYWELVSDAFSGTFLFKHIFHNLEEWMERHKTLMDRIAGDWADIGEDSVSSQPYPSTLPGIPKGSARQLFQYLQGPMEENFTKTHFGKIIRISQKLLCHMTEVYFCFWSWIFEETNCVTSKMVSQHLSHCFSEFLNDNQDAEPIQVHSSHTGSLSQVCPNNLNIGAPLTPLDLCDTTALSPDILSLGYQDSQATGLAISNQSTFASVLPVSGAISSIQGSSNMVVGNNFSPPRGLLDALVRDGRSGVPRSLSFSIDEHWGMQQSDHMLSDRNIHHSGLSVAGAPPGTDCGIHMLSGGNGMGIARPEFQGTFPSAILNYGSMFSSGAEVMPGLVNLHSGVGSAQGNLTLRPQDNALNMMRPVQNPEHQRPMIMPELQMQATQGNSKGAVPPFGGLSSAFSNQMSFPPVQTYPIHHHQQQQQHQITPPQSDVVRYPHLQAPNHAASTQHQAYAIHLAKERQLQQQRILQQHQQLPASNALMPQLHPPQPHLQSRYQGQPQTTSATVSLPLAQTSSLSPTSQKKLHMMPHGLNKNPQTGGSGLTNHMGKQRQRQLQQQSFQQSGRNHPQHRQQSESQQQDTILKGVRRGNMVMNQNFPKDSSFFNGFSASPSGQSSEKAKQVLRLGQGRGLYPGSGLHPVQPSKPLGPPHFSNQSRPQQKMHFGQAIPSSNHQKLQPHQKLVNQTQPTVERALQQNCNSDPPSKSQADQAQADQSLSNLSEMSKKNGNASAHN